MVRLLAFITLCLFGASQAVALPVPKNSGARQQVLVPGAAVPRQAVQPRAVAPRQVTARSSGIDPRYQRQVVSYSGGEAPGTIIVDTGAKHLYLVQSGGKALRYGVGVGKQGFGWSGSAKVGRKAQWPRWTPTQAMMKRQPELKRWAGGMAGGVDNPLGARALYLYRGGRDTLYRIHGTNEPWSIGRSMSSGCIRMLNDDVTDLYTRVKTGTRVIVR